MNAETALSRRGLLKSGGALIVSFALESLLPKELAAQARGGIEAAQPSLELDNFLAIHQDGAVTIYTSQVDVGTGLSTVFRQVAAEELGIPLDRFTVIEGDTATTPNRGGTGGSAGVPRGAAELKRVAATAREALLELGSKRLNLPASELVLIDGQVRPAAGAPGIPVATLIGGRKFSLPVNLEAPLKSASTYTIVGKPILRKDVPDKCEGRHIYLQDFVLPGMLHGRVVRPLSIGAKLVSVDEESISSIPDVRIVRMQSFLGVVSRDEWAAIRAAREIKLTWSDWRGLPGSEDFDSYMRKAASADQTIVSRGSFATGLTSATTLLSATYYWPFQSHASLAPSCAVADYKETATTIWSSTQNPFGVRANLSSVFGIPQDRIRVIYMDGSGSYGTNGADDAAADALLLSKAVGQPVRVQHMRHDEHGWDPKGPAQLLDIRGGIDRAGNIVAWETQMWIPGGPAGQRALVGPEFAGMAQEHGQGAGLMTLNADPPYIAPNVTVVLHQLKDTPLRLSNLRAPGKIANVFAVESFTDELAAAVGMDSLTFRRRALADPRAIAVLDRVATMTGWQARPSPNPRVASGNLLTGRGMAYVRYKQAENYVAIVMEAAVDRTTGQVRVTRVACAHDCGLIVNPDGLRNQIEGNIIQTLSRTLHEEVKFDESSVTTRDWETYPILTFPEVPPLEVALIDRPDQPSYGAGEAASAPVAAALANAIFDATGIRLRRVPLGANGELKAA